MQNHKISLVVPHRGQVVGLWATVFSSVDQLRLCEHPFEIVVVSNGDPESKELTANVEGLTHVHVDQPLSPPAARKVGADCATGELLFFFDNHCVPSTNYFKRGIHFLTDGGMDMVHSSYQFTLQSGEYFHYKLCLDYNFWGESSQFPLDDTRPYPIAVGGHGGFAIRKSAWKDVGGYGPEGLLIGYGGEEVLFDLKMWLYGRSVHLDPRMLHYHYAGNRGYTRHYTAEYYTNMLCCANVVGGEKWMYKLFDSFITKPHIKMGSDWDMYSLLETAYTRSAEYAHEVRSRQQMDLDELLHKFRKEQVAH